MQPIVPTIFRTGDPAQDRNHDETWKTFRRLTNAITTEITRVEGTIPAADDHLVIVDTSDDTPNHLIDKINNSATVTAAVVEVAGERMVEFTAAPAMYDISICHLGPLRSNNLVFGFKACRAISLPASFTGSVGDAAVAALANSTVTIKKNTSTVGTMTVAAGATACVFTVAAQVDLAIGDTLNFWNQAVADATLADLRITLKASIV